MYESIRIQNFRGLKDLTIENLGRVNLLVGANNVGKTSVLEALALLRMHRDGYEFAEILESRGFGEQESLRDSVTSVLNWDDDVDRFLPALVVATEQNGEAHRLEVSHELRRSENGFHDVGEFHVTVESAREEYVRLAYGKRPMEGSGLWTVYGAGGPRTLTLSPGSIRAFPEDADEGANGAVILVSANKRLGPSALAELVSEVQDRGGGEALVSGLREFDDRVDEINVRFERVERQATVTVALRGEGGGFSRLPVTSLGDGTRRLIELRLLLPLARGGVALIDEVESGIYYKNLGRLWETLRSTTVADDLQLFATTHSWECVTAAVEAFRVTPDDFRLHRIPNREDALHTVSYDHEIALAATSGRVEVR